MSPSTRMHRRSVLTGGLALLGLAVAPPAFADVTAQATVTPDEMFARAASWLTAYNGRQVPYSQTTTWGGYRQDCSGYVSMTLKLPMPGPNTVGLTSSSFTTPITIGELRAGDLLIDAAGSNVTRHVVIFERWVDSSRTSYWAYEQRGGHGTDHRTLSYGLNAGSEYKPYRPKNLVPDQPVPSSTPVYETASWSGWTPNLVGHDGQALTASAVSTVVRGDGGIVIYSVRDGYLFETGSDTGWLTMQVPNHQDISAVAAVAVGQTGTIVFTIRGGGVYAAGNNNWRPMAVGNNGQQITATALSVVLRGENQDQQVLYTVQNGKLFEAGSATGWLNLQVPHHDQVSAVSAIQSGTDASVVYTICGGGVYEAGSDGWQPMGVGHNGQQITASALSAVGFDGGQKILYTVQNGNVYEAGNATGWQNLQVPNLTEVSSVSAVRKNGHSSLYTR